MGLNDFKKFIKEEISNYPNLKGDIMDLYQLALDEIDEGESPTEEFYKCINSINEINGRYKR